MKIFKDKKPLAYNKGTGAFPKYLFIGFAVGGAFLIWIIKSLGLPQLITVIIPVAAIIIYCILALKTALFYIREEQIGDNAYYLGFLYTLSSLAYALWKFSAGDNAPEHIISSFGVALWSTIVGISCRVFLSQMRQDPNDIEKGARVRIAETASILTSELYQASVSFNTFRRNLQQSMEEAFDKTNKEVNTSVTSSIEKFSETAEKIVKHIDNAFEEFGSNTKKLNDVSAKTVRALENMNSRIEKIEAPENMITTKIEDVFSGIENSTKNLSSIINSQVSLTGKLSDASGSLLQNIQELNTQISTLKEQSQEIGSNSKEFDILGNKINSIIATFSEMLAELMDKQGNATKSITNHADALEQQLDRSRQYTEDTHQSLALMTKNLAEKLG